MRSFLHLLVLLAIIACLPGCAHTPRWTAGDQWAFGGAVGCHATDAYQTSWGMHHGFEEGNPVVGSHPSDEKIVTIKTAGLSYLWYVEDQMDDHSDRTALSMAALAVCTLVVAHNYQVEH